MLSTSQGYEKAFTRQAGDLVALQLPGHESVGNDDGASSGSASSKGSFRRGALQRATSRYRIDVQAADEADAADAAADAVEKATASRLPPKRRSSLARLSLAPIDPVKTRLSKISRWEFDTMEFNELTSGKALSILGMLLLEEKLGLQPCVTFHWDNKIMQAYLEELEATYCFDALDQNPYVSLLISEERDVEGAGEGRGVRWSQVPARKLARTRTAASQNRIMTIVRHRLTLQTLPRLLPPCLLLFPRAIVIPPTPCPTSLALQHTSSHAAEVVHAVVLLYWDEAISGPVTSKLEALALVFGAAIHDYRHPGISNAFLRSTEDTIYLTHSASSTLERFHVAEAFMLLNNDRLNFIAAMKPSERILFRMLVTQVVLATDLSNGSALIKTFQQTQDKKTDWKTDSGARMSLMSVRLWLRPGRRLLLVVCVYVCVCV